MGGIRQTAIRHSTMQRAVLIAILAICLAGTVSAENLRVGSSIGVVKNITTVSPYIRVMPNINVTQISCPSGYSCVDEAQAEKTWGTGGYFTYSAGSACDYNQWKQPMYCYQQKISISKNRDIPVRNIVVNDSPGKQLVRVIQPEGVHTLQPDLNPAEQGKIPVRKISGAIINQSFVEQNNQPVKINQAGKIPVLVGGEGGAAQGVPIIEPVRPVPAIDKQAGTQNTGILAFFTGIFGGGASQQPSPPVGVRAVPGLDQPAGGTIAGVTAVHNPGIVEDIGSFFGSLFSKGNGGPDSCKPPQVYVNGECISTGISPVKCGQIYCPQGQICSNDQCVAVEVSPECGNGFECPSGKTCLNGYCMWGDPKCDPGVSDCGGGCNVHLSADSQNCGACRYVCPASAPDCWLGSCIDVTNCGEGMTRCDMNCVNISNDPQNCGACGVICGEGTVCQNGQCIQSTVNPSNDAIKTCIASTSQPGSQAPDIASLSECPETQQALTEIRVNWGDGSKINYPRDGQTGVEGYSNSYKFSASHVYLNAGTYPITIEACNADTVSHKFSCDNIQFGHTTNPLQQNSGTLDIAGSTQRIGEDVSFRYQGGSDHYKVKSIVVMDIPLEILNPATGKSEPFTSNELPGASRGLQKTNPAPGDIFTFSKVKNCIIPAGCAQTVTKSRIISKVVLSDNSERIITDTTV